MSDIPADSQGRPHPDRRPDERLEPTPVSEHNPGGLMPDLRGRAVDSGRNPEELDPLQDDEDHLRRASSLPGAARP